MIRISDYIFEKSEKARKGVETIMGGQILELQSDEHISVIISVLAEKKNNVVSMDDALVFGEQMCDKYADAFKALAN